MTDETRVVLVKPGDVLLIGGVKFNNLDEAGETVRRLRELIGSPVAVFAEDIEVDQLDHTQLLDLLERAKAKLPGEKP